MEYIYRAAEYIQGAPGKDSPGIVPKDMECRDRDGHQLLYLAFNQDQTCFACGFSNGFRIYRTSDLTETVREVFEDGGIGIVEMLFRTQYVALVGGGNRPAFPRSSVVIWDQQTRQSKIELDMRADIVAVKLHRERIVIALPHLITVFSFTADPQKLHTFETADNPSGICALCPSLENYMLAFPGTRQGQVQVLDLADTGKSMSIVPAHTTSILALAINLEGTLLATASERGTLIRIFDLATGKQLHEFRRGVQPAMIYSLTFSNDSSLLCVSCSTGTVHVVDVKGGGEAGSRNTRSALSWAKDYLPSYFSSTWGFAKFSMPASNVPAVCAFVMAGPGRTMSGTDISGVTEAQSAGTAMATDSADDSPRSSTEAGPYPELITVAVDGKCYRCSLNVGQEELDQNGGSLPLTSAKPWL
eukprot:Clim_evm23s240 gene=Clim_evmTU23s240